MKPALPVALLLLLPAPALGAGPWRTQIAPAVAEAAAGHKLILVDLYAEWCGWCKELEKQVFSTPRFRDFAGQFVLLRVDTEDRGEGSKLAGRFGAYNLPTTLILDSNLARVGRIEGFAPTEEYIAQIQRQLDGHREYERRIAAAPSLTDAAQLRDLATEAHARQDGARAAALLRRSLAAETDAQLRARLQYLLADALRLARQWDAAQQELAAVRAAAALLRDRDLVERADLLAFNLADDRGDCRQAIAVLEDFLRVHPRSGYSGQAAQTLAALRTDKAACT
jgi:thioredoxin-like negative regulator of GroEL